MRRKLNIRPKSARHREEAAKLAAILINGVAIACMIGASFGPWLNPSLAWGLHSLILLLAACVAHLLAQFVLSMGFVESPDDN
jgi:hypothetical protein